MDPLLIVSDVTLNHPRTLGSVATACQFRICSLLPIAFDHFGFLLLLENKKTATTTTAGQQEQQQQQQKQRQ